MANIEYMSISHLIDSSTNGSSSSPSSTAHRIGEVHLGVTAAAVASPACASRPLQDDSHPRQRDDDALSHETIEANGHAGATHPPTVIPTRLSGVFETDVTPQLRAEMYRVALGLTRNRADAEDLLQDTMLKAFRGYGQLRPETFLKAWLYTIMRNTWISNSRKAARRPSESPLDELVDSARFNRSAISTGQNVNSAENDVLQHVVDPDLLAAFTKLSEEMRTTMFYAVVKGMSCRDVAELMGVSVNTVLTRVHRSKKSLRRSLAEIADQKRRDASHAAHRATQTHPRHGTAFATAGSRYPSPDVRRTASSL